MSNNKKILSVFLALIMALSVFTSVPLSASAAQVDTADTGEIDPGFRYSIKNGEATITGYKGYETDLEIPSEINDKPVTRIGDEAFRGLIKITSITIPDTVKSIGRQAFFYCSGLTSIMIPSSVTSIDYGAFFGCSGLTSIKVSEDNPVFDSRDNCNAIINTETNELIFGFKNTIIPDTVTIIHYSAFYRCTELTSITIPNSVISIYNSAFKECTGLTSITIPDSVTSIGNNAFGGCTGLTNVKIGDSVTNIGFCAFSGCPGLTNVTIPDTVTSISDHAFSNCTGLTSIKISNSIKIIDCGMFDGCTGLTSITIPDSVTSIYDEAFRYCSGLTSITIPDSVTSINRNVFSGCTGLTDVRLPKSVTSIGNRAFSNCSALTRITIPASVTEIGDDVFSDCSDDFAIYGYPGSVAQEYAEEYGFTFIAVDVAPTETPTEAPTEAPTAAPTEAPTEVPTEYNDSDYFSYSITNGEATVYGCSSSLIDVVIPDTLGGCPVTGIADEAFENHPEMTSIVIPETVTSIGSGVFWHCSGLTSIKVSEGNTVYDSRDNCNAIIKTETNELIFGCRNTVIPDTVTSIGVHAFWYCTELTNIVIPDSVTSIANGAFHCCVGLTSIIIPNSVTSISNQAFSYCSGLTSLKVAEDNPVYDSRDNCNAIIKTETNELICGFKNTVIPDTVTSIGDYAFYDCSGLTSITFPDSVTSIGESAFQNCENLTSVTFGDSVTSIGDSAFYVCSGLTSLTIPDSVTSIGTYAFSGCSGLRELVLPNSDIGVWGSFGGSSKLERLVIPEKIHDLEFSGFGTVFHYGDSNKPIFEKDPDSNLVIYGYYGTEAERYATEYGIPFRMIAPATSDEVSVDAPDGTTYSVVQKATEDEASPDESAPIHNQPLPEGSILLDVYDITLRSAEDETPIQPESPVTIRIRCDNPNAHVFRREADGSLTDMNARYEDGYLIFEADHFSIYLVVELGAEVDIALSGDADGDGDISAIDATVIQRHLAGMKLPSTIEWNEAACDVNGDGEVDIIDVTYIQRYLANIAIPYPIGERV